MTFLLRRSLDSAVFLSLLLPASIGFAQGPSDVAVQAIISAASDTAVGRPVLLDASASRVTGEGVQFLWFVSGVPEPISRTVDAIYTPDKPGRLKFRVIVRAMQDGALRESQAVHEVEVYRRKMVVLAGNLIPRENIAAQVREASGTQLYVSVRQSQESAASDRFVQFLVEQIPGLRGADAVVLWTDGASGLQALLQAMQRTGRPPDFSAQTIVIVTNERLATVQRTALAPFAVLRPQRILLIHPDALGTLFRAPDIPAFLASAKQRDVSAAVVDPSTPPPALWNVLTILVNALLASGVASQTVLLLLMLPVIATILSFLKQIVGVATFGLFVPSIIALSFLVLGWVPGFFFFLFIVAVGSLSRMFIYKLHILFVPKVAIIITIISTSLLLLVAANLVFGVILSREAVFILLIMSTLSESFLTTKAEQGLLSAFSGTAQTLVSALICVAIVSWTPFQTVVLAYPEILLLTVALNLLIGRYTGLRFSEYLRFREVFRHLAQG